MELRFLYVGSDDTDRDLAAWLAMPGARLRWRFQAFGADVAAVDLGGTPLVLLADHRPAGSVLPIYAVADLDDATDAMVAGGWTVQVGPLATPEGPATVLGDAGGVTVALLRVDRPGAMDDAYDDDANGHARARPVGAGCHSSPAGTTRTGTAERCSSLCGTDPRMAPTMGRSPRPPDHDDPGLALEGRLEKGLDGAHGHHQDLGVHAGVDLLGRRPGPSATMSSPIFSSLAL